MSPASLPLSVRVIHFFLCLALGADSPSKGVWKYVAIGVAAVAVVMVCGTFVIWKKRAASSSTRRKDPNETDFGSHVNYAMTERPAAEKTAGEFRVVKEKSAVWGGSSAVQSGLESRVLFNFLSF